MSAGESTGSIPKPFLLALHGAALVAVAVAVLLLATGRVETRWFGGGVLAAVGILIVAYLTLVLADRIEAAE